MNPAGEEVEQCPYDKSHIILKHRMPIHLTRCRRNHTNEEKVPCPYNATHMLLKPELAYHMKNCANRVTIDKYVYKTDGDTKMPDIPEVQGVTYSEDWSEEQHPTYNARESIQNKPILQTTLNVTMSAAEKRKMKMNERERLQQLTMNMEKSKSFPIQEDKSMRRPMNKSSAETNSDQVLVEKIKMGANVLTTPQIGAGAIKFKPMEKIAQKETDDITDSLKNMRIESDVTKSNSSPWSNLMKSNSSALQNMGELEMAKNFPPLRKKNT